MIRRPPRSTLSSSSAASDVYKRQYQRRVRESAMEEIDAKVVVIGNTGVGKTCIVLRYVQEKFFNHTASTIGASFMIRKLFIDDTRLTLQIWDTAGQERFRSMGPMYYLSLIHISEPTRLLSISYAVFCLKKKKKTIHCK
eukprot:TRINITY_DN10451_c0_g1_i1.p1 TRINITY_DN10451_c0_g1~~TRINITY_DN10451_c0_g1_i1.p1  ORF type:complete len:140 (-),score=50.37 TRINITY_DN10451_c0_g1_i1:99-518(-)